MLAASTEFAATLLASGTRTGQHPNTHRGPQQPTPGLQQQSCEGSVPAAAAVPSTQQTPEGSACPHTMAPTAVEQLDLPPVQEENQAAELAQATASPGPQKRGRGRPRGSKNKKRQPFRKEKTVELPIQEPVGGGNEGSGSPTAPVQSSKAHTRTRSTRSTVMLTTSIPERTAVAPLVAAAPHQPPLTKQPTAKLRSTAKPLPEHRFTHEPSQPKPHKRLLVKPSSSTPSAKRTRQLQAIAPAHARVPHSHAPAVFTGVTMHEPEQAEVPMHVPAQEIASHLNGYCAASALSAVQSTQAEYRPLIFKAMDNGETARATKLEEMRDKEIEQLLKTVAQKGQ